MILKEDFRQKYVQLLAGGEPIVSVHCPSISYCNFVDKTHTMDRNVQANNLTTAMLVSLKAF